MEQTALQDAAAWMTRLSGGQPDAATRAAFDAWLRESPAHVAAMDLMERTWRGSASLRGAEPPRPAPRTAASRTARARRPAPVWIGALAAAACGVIVVGAHWGTTRPLDLGTGVGEQLSRALPDGSTAVLNTDTAAVVRYGWFRRQVRLTRGEAEFAVAADRRRPFVVQARDVQVRAVGTRFVVRATGADTAVFLVEGEVEVTRDGRPVARLGPGEGVRVTSAGSVRALANRDLEQVLAWREGRIEFDRTPLAEALQEFHRYSARRVELAPGLERLTVSGVYRTGDIAPFAHAVARMHDLEVERGAGDGLRLKPRA